MYVLAVTTTPTAWTGTSALVGRAERIRVALGLHPQLARERRRELDLFDRMLPEARYVGEVGLDGSPELRDQWHDQLAVFEHVLSSCRAAGGRIMSIHSRRAVSAVLERLESYRDAAVPVLHWYSGSFKELERAVALGCWFSVGPAMASSKNGQALISRMPPERVVTETDGPFAALGDRRLVPWDVNIAVPKLAELWSVSRESAEARLRTNLRDLLREAPSV
jgi:TatD DNase family protein